jgi:hypothetical protein
VNAGALLSEVCYAYKYPIDYVMGMPIRRFFMMQKQARLIRLRDLSDAVDIALSGICTIDYAKDLKTRYANMYRTIETGDEEPEKSKPVEAAFVTPEPTGMSQVEAKDRVFAIFTQVRRATSGR